MRTVAKFSKVSFEQFKMDLEKAVGNMYSENQVREFYDDIQLPHRSTVGSAGYDFHSPITIVINPDTPSLIPTGICCKMDKDWVLTLHVRSSLGFKLGVRLRNGTGIIDSDYVNADNEGHIMAKLTTEEPTVINKGDRFIQGLFLPYGVTIDDQAEGERLGGFGSTGK